MNIDVHIFVFLRRVQGDVFKLLLLSDQNPQIFKLQKKEKHQINILQKAGTNYCISIHIHLFPDRLVFSVKACLPLTSFTVASSKKTHLEDLVWKAKAQ